MRVTVLGSGTSSGVPTIGCECATCQSDDKRDKRLRPSVMVEIDGKRIIIDTSSDFRQQCIENGIASIDAVIYTHHHFDHIAGFDDLRAFNFTSKKSIPVYLTQETYIHLSRIFEYAFDQTKRKESSAPQVKVSFIDKAVFSASGITCTPIPLKHGSMDVTGYRIKDFAYCTDCSEITEEGFDLLKGVRFLILDGLRYRPHPTHLTIAQAIQVAEKIGAEHTWLTHIAHDVKHDEGNQYLPKQMSLGFDGLTIEIDSSGEMISI